MCEYNYLDFTWEDGDEDRYCTNDKCELCTCPISEINCEDCPEYVEKEDLNKLEIGAKQ